MRDYLYIWNDVGNKSLIISGMEFKDLNFLHENKTLIALKHKSDLAQCDYSRSKFYYFDSCDIKILNSQNIYEWGDFVWVVCSGNKIPILNYNDVTNILYFGHETKVSRQFENNEILGCFYAHDDGWYLKICYATSELRDIIVRQLIESGRLRGGNFDEILRGQSAFLFYKKNLYKVEKTNDIDAILNKYLK